MKIRFLPTTWVLFLTLFSVGLSVSASAFAELPPLIPREILFGNPEKQSPAISPDGKQLAWIAPDKRNVLQVWVKTIGQNDDRIVTADEKRGIRNFKWAENSRVIGYLQDKDGDENWHLYGVDLVSGKTTDFTPFKNVQAQILGTDRKFPETWLVSLNQRNPQLHDVYRLNLITGELVLDTENPGDVVGFTEDDEFRVRAATVVTKDGGTEIRIRDVLQDGKLGPWRSWLKASSSETLSFLSFAKDGQHVYLNSSLESDTARIVVKDIRTGKERFLAGSREVDASAVLFHPVRRTVEAVAFAPGRLHWKVTDPAVRADFKAIAKLYDGDFNITSRDHSDRLWIAGFTSDQGSERYYLWDRAARKGTFLFAQRPKLEGLPLASMKPVSFPARDGLKLHAYLTLPVGIPAKNLPMVLLVHGGPWSRDMWGYDAEPQWFANRGYATLQVNYRGSTGYGKKHLNAGNRQWGLKMHDDLIDSVNWAVKQGMVDAKKVAIYGGSYGGYAALAGVTFTPTFFNCAVDIVGPSNLFTLIQSIPPYWKPMRALFDVRVGNIDDPGDKELLTNASPLFRANKIVRPLLIGQGANDPRVKQAESEQIVSAIQKNGGKVTYVLYPDEGHGFHRPPNRMDFNGRAEKFLADNLGGRYEAVKGEKEPGSTAVVKEIGKP